MKFTKILRTTALAASLATVLGLVLTPTPAAAANATGNTVFKVVLQPVVILDYYKEIDLTIPSAALASLAGGASNSTNVSAITAAVSSGGSLSASAALSTTGNPINAVTLDITHAYSVRSITTATAGNTTVSVAFAASGGSTSTTATLTGITATGSTIGLSNPGTALASFTGTGLGAAQANYGDVSMQLDLTNAMSADTYAGATIVITATST